MKNKATVIIIGSIITLGAIVFLITYPKKSIDKASSPASYKNTLTSDEKRMFDNYNIYSFPTNFNAQYLKSTGETTRYYEQIIAFSGTIAEINNTFSDRPYYKIALDPNTSLWVYIMGVPSNDRIKVNDKVKVLGYFIKNEEGDEFTEYNKSGHLVIGFGLYNITTKQLYYNKEGISQIETWIKGQIPTP